MKKVKATIKMTDGEYGLLVMACKELNCTMNECLSEAIHGFIQISITEGDKYAEQSEDDQENN